MRRLARTLGPAACSRCALTAAGVRRLTPARAPARRDARAAPRRLRARRPTPEAATPTSLIWTDALKIDAVKAVADAFGEANGITVEVQAISEDLQSNFVTANAAGNGPDVVVGAHDWIGNLVQNGAIEPAAT